jgi:preprotein translocase subunit SecD
MGAGCSSSETMKPAATGPVATDPSVTDPSITGQGGHTLTVFYEATDAMSPEALANAGEMIRQRMEAAGYVAEVTSDDQTIQLVLVGITEEQAAAFTAEAEQPAEAIYVRPAVGGCQILEDSGSNTSDTLPIVESDPTTQQWLPMHGAGPIQYCPVGPAQGTGAVFANDAIADIANGAWAITVSLRPGAEGADIWNALAAKCFNRDTDCPTGQLAIELNGELLTVATVQTPVFEGTVQIAGSFTEADARAVARQINAGSLPVSLRITNTQFS